MSKSALQCAAAAAVLLVSLPCLAEDDDVTIVKNPETGSSDAGTPEITVGVPAEATAKTSTTGGGGQAGVGFVYSYKDDNRDFSLRTRINLAASSFEIADGNHQDYAAVLLQPDLRGASAAVDVGFNGRWQVGGGTFTLGAAGGARLSPTMTWTVTDKLPDGMGGVTEQRTSRNAVAGNVLGAVVLSFEIRGVLATETARIVLELPFSTRFLMGDATNDKQFLLRTLGDANTVYFGFDPRLHVTVGDLGLFAAVTIVGAHGTQVPGLTGANVIIGVEVMGDVIKWSPQGGTVKAPKSDDAAQRRSLLSI